MSTTDKDRDTGSGLSTAMALLEAEAGRAFPAAALLVADRGAVRLSCAVGEAPCGTDTWFDLASLTKALCTAVLMMRLCEQGRLRLSDEALPGVRYAHLLAHGSGLPAWQPLYALALAAPPPDRRAAIVAAAAAAPRGPAGEKSVYSDLGFILLGARIEEAGGDRLDRLFAGVAAALGADLSFRPVGEAAAIAPERCAPTWPIAGGVGPFGEPLRGVVHDDNARAMGGVAGHAGLFGTAGGVARVAQALCDAFADRDTPLRRALGVSPKTVRRFFARAGDVVPGTNWGLGWDHPEPPGRGSSAGERWSRDGVGHLGFTGCSLWMEPAAGRYVVLLSNRADARTAEDAEHAKRRLAALRPALHDAAAAALAEGTGDLPAQPA